MPLPTEKTKPYLNASTANVLLYGAPKTGKTTLAASIDPENTLFVACEPGLAAQSVYAVEISDWASFRELCAELDAERDRFKTIVIDTVGDLYGYCLAHVLEVNEIRDPSADNSRGYSLAKDEFRRVVSKLMALGRGVWFIAHAEDRDIKTRTGEITKTIPGLTGKTMDFLAQRADFILLLEVTSTEHGEVRQLRTAKTENYEAGGRVSLPDPIPLDAAALSKAIEEACEQINHAGKAPADNKKGADK